MSNVEIYAPGTRLYRPDGRTATVVYCRDDEARIIHDAYQADDGTTVGEAEWTGPPADLANCWNLAP